MPIYRYEHTSSEDAPAPLDSCALGTEFEWIQSIKAERLTECPECRAPVVRLIPRSIGVVAVKSAAELKNLGFSKLVRRDSGVYENVTAGSGEKRIVDANE